MEQLLYGDPVARQLDEISFKVFQDAKSNNKIPHLTAITVGDKLRLVKSDLFGDIESYKCSGTPADCVKIAKHHILKNRNIDLIASGINHGSNSSISVLYSGTMSAAIEDILTIVPDF